MRVLIAGAGKVGYNIAKSLMLKHEVIVIDQNQEAIHHIQETLDVLAMYGNIENPHIFLGIPKEIDLFIAVTDMDEVNLLSCLIIDNIATVKKKIIRLRNSFFANDQIKEKLSIDDTIFPSVEAAQPFQYLIDFPYARNVKTFKHTKALLISIRLPEDFETTMIENWMVELDQSLVITGIERQSDFYVPKPTEMLLPNDLVYLLAFPSAIKSLHCNLFGHQPSAPIKNCIIFGADSLGIEIAKVLDKKGVNIQMIDRDLNACKNANQILKNRVTVLKSSYDSEHFIERNGSKVDMFISAMKHDEYNITKCMEAKQIGIKKVVGINNDRAYSALMRKMDIEVVRGEKISAYHSILEKIHSSHVIVQKNFCGGEGTLFLRKIFHTPQTNDNLLKLPVKLEPHCALFIIRGEKILSLLSIGTLQKDDIILISAPQMLEDALKKWLDSAL